MEEKFTLLAGTYDQRHKLNACNRSFPSYLLRQLEDGCTIETLEKIASSFPIFKYRTQITIHGHFPELETSRVGYYKNLFKNENGSLGVRYSAIDAEKKERLANILKYAGWSSKSSSLSFTLEKYARVERNEVPRTVETYKKEAERINLNLFVGSVDVTVAPFFGMYYVTLVVTPLYFYEKNFTSLVENLSGMTISELEHIRDATIAAKKEREAKWEQRYKEEQEKRRKESEEFKANNPLPFENKNNYTLQVNDVVAFYNENFYGIRIEFCKVIKAGGRMCFKPCDRDGRTGYEKGRQIVKLTGNFNVRTA